MEYATLGFYATEILLWAAVLLFIVWYWKKWKREKSKWKIRFRLTKDRIFITACLSLISYLFISIVWSPDKSLALQQSLRVMEAFLLFFIFTLGPLKFNEAVKWLALGAVLPSMLGIWQFFSQSTFAFKWLGLAEHIVSNPGASVIVGDEIGRWLRSYGPFAHPNVLGGYAAMVIVLMLLKLKDCKACPEQSRRTERLPFYLFISYLLSLIFIISVIFFSFSRSALLALIIIILLNCYIVFKQKKFSYLPSAALDSPRDGSLRTSLSLISCLILPIIILSVLLFPALKTRVTVSSSYEVASVVERAQGFNEGWEIFKDNKWLGVGAGNYIAYLQKIDPDRQSWEYQPVHNAGLLLLAEMGLFGVALLFFVLLSLISFLFSLVTNQESQVDACKRSRKITVFCYLPARHRLRHQVLAGGCSVFCYFVLAFFDHYLISSYTGLILTGIFFGLALKHSREVVPS